MGARMSGQRETRPVSRRKLVIAAIAALSVIVDTTPAQALTAWAPTVPAGASVSATPDQPGVGGVHVAPTSFRAAVSQAADSYRPTRTRWPDPADVTVAVAPAKNHGGNVAPVTVEPVDASAAPAGARVRILDRNRTKALGINGVVLTVAASSAGNGRVRAVVDYSGFAEAFGGNYGSRLRLVQLPACALTTPQVAQCRRAKALPSINRPTERRLQADITLAGEETAWGFSASQTRLVSQPVVLAALSDPASQGAGTYTATELSASGSWAAGDSTGSFRYSYPISAPAATTSTGPQLGLGYDSGSVDGQTAATQAQASWVGNGWSMPRSYIEHSFVSCEDDPGGVPSPVETPDTCYNGPILTMSLNGSSTVLVWDAGKSVWKPQIDNGEVIGHITNSGNGSATYNTDYWTVTTRDGTVYSFGRNQLPGWTAGKDRTNSVDHQPVYSAHAGDPCYQISGSGFANSVCRMAYRWNLDYVVDTRGGAMAYYYKQDTNYYGRNEGAVDDSYIRDSYLDHIDYGFTDGNAYGTAPNRVVFGTGPRCVTEPCLPLDDTTKANWTDVPYDLICAGTDCNAWGVSFFSTVALKSVTTQQWNVANAGYENVDSYALTHTMPETGDGTAPTLWLSSITRTGYAGDGPAIAMPPVQFGSVKLPNRVDTVADGLVALQKHRLATITTETGSIATVHYGLPEPCTAPVTLVPATNTKSCYPMRWTPAGYPDAITDWFHKYAVTSITAYDAISQRDSVVSYRYLGGAGWRYDENELVQAKYRTYGQFRGYAKVQTLSGDGITDAQSLSEVVYYRGMSRNNSTTAVYLTDSLGGTHEDADQLAGLELEGTTYLGDGGPVDSSNITHYWISAPTATRTRTGLPDLTATTTGAVQALHRQALTATGTTTWRYTQTDSSYDADINSLTFGLLLRSYNHTVPADPALDHCTTLTYAPPNTTKNLVGLISETETVSAKCGGFTQGAPISVPATVNTLGAATANRPSQVVSAERTYYDDPTFSTTFPQSSAPSKGLPTMARKAVDYTGGSYTWQTASRSTYDSYGRVVDIYDANGNMTTTGYTMNSLGLTTAISTTDPLSHTSSATLDTRRGSTLTETDPNNVVTTRQYDTLGRQTRVWTHNRVAPAPANIVFTYNMVNNGVTYIKTEKLNETLGYQTSVVLYDTLMRQRQTQTVTPKSGRMVTDTFYDSRGLVQATNDGWWDENTLPNGTIVTATDLGAQVPRQRLFTHDGLGRVVKEERGANNATVSTTITVYNGDRTTVIPPEGSQVTTVVTDALERVSQFVEYTTNPVVNVPANTFTGIFTISGGTAISTAYTFDAHGNQTTITNNAGTTWNRTFDLSGRATTISDPDAGTTTLTYDANGNPIESTDARGKTTSFTYDSLNRKTGHYASSAANQIAFGQPGANQLAKWVYDNSDNAIAGMTNPIGHQTSSTAYWNGAAYTKQLRGFDVFGNSLGVNITLPASEGSVLGSTYTLKHTYSSNTGLLLQDIYPLKWGLPLETVNHGYAGALDLPKTLGGLAGYTDNTTYDAYGRVNYTVFGASPNTADITYTYDAHTGNLKNRLVKRLATTPNQVDEQAYDRDKSGNITKQTSTRLASASPNETQCFRYDTINRLTAAWTANDNCATTPTSGNRTMVGSALGAASTYWTTWNIDDRGNRTQEKRWGTTAAGDTTTTFTYNGNSTNQPDTLTGTTSVGALPQSTTYAYDAAGNMTNRNAGNGNQTLTWDDAGRLSGITGSTPGNSSFIYDADGELLLQKDPGKTTLYLPGQQITLNTTTNTTTGVRYYPLPGGATALRTGSGTNYKFTISDLHGTSELLLDNTAQIPTWRQFTPYGAPRGTAITWPDNRGFLNKPTNAGTGLTNVGARYYDPATGRFISVDPELQPEVPQSLNGYLYANNNPVTYLDPTGRDWWDDLKRRWKEAWDDENSPVGTCFGGEWCYATQQAIKNNDYSGFHIMLGFYSMLPIPIINDGAAWLDVELYEIEGNQAAADELRDTIGANNSLMAVGDVVVPVGAMRLSKKIFTWVSKKLNRRTFIHELDISVSAGAKFEDTKVDYGSTGLSRIAQLYREHYLSGPASDINPNQNVAVFIVQTPDGKYKAIVGANIPNGGPDSEALITRLLEEKGYKDAQVKAIYSERAPCGPERQNCDFLLNSRFSGAKVSYSFDWAESSDGKAAKAIKEWQETTWNLKMGRI